MNNALHGFTRAVPIKQKKKRITGSLPFSIAYISEAGFQTNFRQKGNQVF
jgi:hypothetical protein